MSDSSPPSPDAVPLPNHTPCVEMRHHPVRGRGVFALQPISASTLIDVSPILLFPHAEYSAHGRYTLLDHYTYRWPGGFALALGLGSIFNHSRKPNVGFMRDTERSVIRYVTTKDIKIGEELCISYGRSDGMWFDDDEGLEAVEESEPESEENMFARLRLWDDDGSDGD